MNKFIIRKEGKKEAKNRTKKVRRKEGKVTTKRV